MASRKPPNEIEGIIQGYQRIILAGSNEWVTVCAVEGERDVGILASEVDRHSVSRGRYGH